MTTTLEPTDTEAVDSDVLPVTADVEQPELDSAGEGADDAPPPAAEKRSRRRRVALLAFLATLAVILAGFSVWYIVLRKPITDLPLPLPIAEPMPGYGYSLYGPLHPTGVAVNPDGSRIYVTQTDSDAAVMVFDASRNRIATLTPPTTSADHVFVYVAINPVDGNVYVSDRLAAAIYIYSPDGDYVRTFDTPSSLAGWTPLGLNFAANGDMFVTDASTGVIDQFARDGSFVRTIGSEGDYSFPNAVAEDAAGRIYIADSNHGRVVVLDANGAQLAVVRRGAREGDVGMPRGMVLDDQGRLFVTDTTDSAVKVYRVAADPTAAPVYLGRFGSDAGADGALRYPNSVAADVHGRLYVADWANNRVQVWTY